MALLTPLAGAQTVTTINGSLSYGRLWFSTVTFAATYPDCDGVEDRSAFQSPAYWYELTPITTGTYTFSASAAFPLSLHLAETVGFSPGTLDLEHVCAIARGDFVTAPSFAHDLTAATNYTLVVSTTDFAGDFSVEITGPDAVDYVELPVELTAFEAIVDGPAVRLAWETASETINAGFEVQRSRDAETPAAREERAWQTLGFVEGAGTTAERQAYHFEDPAPPTGVDRLFYRLRQVDFDGAFSYSPVVDVAMQTPAAFALAANYPNPFNPQTTIRFELPTAAAVRLEVLDLLGRTVAVLAEDARPAGRHEVTFDAGALPGGLYFYRIAAGPFLAVRQMVLVK